MVPQVPDGSHLATLDVCLAGVFVGRGERIPDDLYDAWRRRLASLGLGSPHEAASTERPS